MTLSLYVTTKAQLRMLFLLTSLAGLSFFLVPYFLSFNVSIVGATEGDGQQVQIQQDDQDANKPHWLVGSYYSTQKGLTATLLLNNKGNQPLEVRPTIYNLSGQAIEIPPVSVEASSFRFVNLQEWAAMGGESLFARQHQVVSRWQSAHRSI